MKVEPIDLLLEARIASAAHPWSLRRRMMLIVGVGTVASWLVGGIVVLLLAHEQNAQLHIARLEDFAHVLMRFAAHEIEEIRTERPGDIVHIETSVTLDPRFRYQVRDQRGELVLVSADTAIEPFVPLGAIGHQEVEIGGVEHYVYSMWNDAHTLHLQMIERPDQEAFALAILGRALAVGFIVTVLVLLAVKMWMLRRATQALDQAANQLVNRSPGDLQPIVADNPPSELVPLLKAINCLFTRFRSAMEAEHAFSAKAAHELRTPLAAVRIQAQVADRASETGGAHEALQQLGVCVERASRMIDQLLTLARFESMPVAPTSMALVRIDRIVELALNEVRPMLVQRTIDLEVRVEPATVRGLEFGLVSLVRNLLENALRYTPNAGIVRVESWQEGPATYIVVEDSGPGIAPEERGRVFEPFYRIGTDGGDGYGIGLAIVRSVERVHGGEISLSESALGGLRVVVRLPGVDPPSAREPVG